MEQPNQTRVRIELSSTPFRGRPTKHKALHIFAVMLDYPDGISERNLRHLVNGNSLKNEHFRRTLEEMRNTGIVYVESVYQGFPIYRLQTNRGKRKDRVDISGRKISYKQGGTARYFVSINGDLVDASSALKAQDIKTGTFYNVMARFRNRAEFPESEIPQKAFEYCMKLKSDGLLRGRQEVVSQENRSRVDHKRPYEKDPMFGGVSSIFEVASRGM